MAAPFVQGQLRQKPLTVTVSSQCAHCGQAMELTIDQDLNFEIQGGGEEPVVFIPDVNLFKIEDDNIIHDF